MGNRLAHGTLGKRAHSVGRRHSRHLILLQRIHGGSNKPIVDRPMDREVEVGERGDASSCLLDARHEARSHAELGDGNRGGDDAVHPELANALGAVEEGVR